MRLIRSKGVSLWFCTQNPMDIPPKLLGQLGHRVQHALRAYIPAERKQLKAVVELGVGEALISFLDPQGVPQPVRRALLQASPLGPRSR